MPIYDVAFCHLPAAEDVVQDSVDVEITEVNKVNAVEVSDDDVLITHVEEGRSKKDKKHKRGKDTKSERRGSKDRKRKRSRSRDRYISKCLLQ